MTVLRTEEAGRLFDATTSGLEMVTWLTELMETPACPGIGDRIHIKRNEIVIQRSSRGIDLIRPCRQVIQICAVGRGIEGNFATPAAGAPNTPTHRR